ncbi:MAG: hypothetical protein PVJ52_03075 [Candidatus Woesebacteria bacterium]|jgi:large subunit ribosomal protein L1
MGKTKTAVVSGMPDEKLSGEEKYRKKQKKKKQEEKKKKKQVTGVGLKGGERIQVIGGELPPESTEKEKDTEEKVKKAKKKKSKARGKKYKKAQAKVDKNKQYPIKEAIKLVKETSYSKFDGSVEFHLTVKKQNLSTNVELPHSTGKKKKIEVADENTIKKLKKGEIDFDVLLATPKWMPKLVPFAKTLGPKGLMPNPKNQTLIKKKSDAKKFSADRLEIKTERKVPLIHLVVGKVSQKEKELIENVEAIIKAVTKRQIKKAYLTSTMGPSIKLSI